MQNNINQLEILQNRLNNEDKQLLGEIYAPTAVAVPPEDAFNGLCVMPDGAIRHYGSGLQDVA